jgi:hypothetical protein
MSAEFTSIQGCRLEKFFTELGHLRDERRKGNQAGLGEFFKELQLAVRETNSPDAFSILDVLGIGADEVKHSSILAWLINPKSRHGRGAEFLGAFLEAASITVDGDTLHDCKVYTEFPGQESIVDLMVYARGRFLLYVENKILSPEGPDQLNREHRDLLRLADALRTPPSGTYGIFLTPAGAQPTTGDQHFWKPLSYEILADQFEKIASSLDSTKLGMVTIDLVETYRTWSK